jgi:tetratricopeptide (TPR) repeat protein
VGLAQAQTPSPLQEVRRLLRAEQPALAIQQAEQALQEQPQNAQLRFLQGVAQSQAGQNEAAQATFLALTQAYPELPEPYNNLAVLYAAAGELDLARTALESALRIHPSYATALRNLGDVYARLAGRAWQQALAIDPTDATLRPKLEHWQHLPIVSLPLQNP